MIAIGYNIKGERKEYKINIDGSLLCYGQDLISIEIPEGVKQIDCENNQLIELTIPEGVKYLDCHNNILTELNIPKSVKYLNCDKNVIGLKNIDWECNIILF